MNESEQRAFTDAWLGKRADGTIDTNHQNKLLNLARRFASVFREDPEDLLQRVFLQIWRGEQGWTKDDLVLRRAERTMRGMYATKKRSGELKYTTQFEGEEHADLSPSSKPNPEQSNVLKEDETLKVDVFAEVDESLPEGDVGSRARAALPFFREGLSAEEIALKLDLGARQVEKARELIAETIRAVLKRRRLTIQRQAS